MFYIALNRPCTPMDELPITGSYAPDPPVRGLLIAQNKPTNRYRVAFLINSSNTQWRFNTLGEQRQIAGIGDLHSQNLPLQ